MADENCDHPRERLRATSPARPILTCNTVCTKRCSVMTMKPKVYLETTIPSYLTSWPSRDLVTAAHQQVTRQWWESRRDQFELYVSEIVIEAVCRANGYQPPTICTPEEFLEG